MNKSQENVYGFCRNCHKPKSDFDWCPSCDCEALIKEFPNWTSGNEIIDEFIRESQMNSTSYTTYLEWIPSEDLSEPEYKTKGGFGKVYFANWYKGERITDFWNDENEESKRQRSISLPVVIKVLEEKEGISLEFINEYKNQHKCSINGKNFLRIYGFTKLSDGYGAVIQRAKSGSLWQYLKDGHSTLSWQQKVGILSYIVDDLAIIHDAGLIHRDFHPGNILMDGDMPFLCDFGLSEIEDNSQDKEKDKDKKICGILPYVAPEILLDRPYTKAVDIYSFGIIMSEIATGRFPFENLKKDIKLNLAICEGLRPYVDKNIPSQYVSVMKGCWESDPTKRPDIKKLKEIFSRWRLSPPFNIVQQFEEGDTLKSSDNMILAEEIKFYDGQSLEFETGIVPSSKESLESEDDDDNQKPKEEINEYTANVVFATTKLQSFFLKSKPEEN